MPARGFPLSYTPHTHRAFEWSARVHPLMPLLIGVVGTVLLGLFALWVSWLIGIVAAVTAGDEPDIAVRAPVTLYMMVGYLPMAVYYLWKWTDRHLDSIADRLGVDLPVLDFPRTASNLLGATGALMMYGLFLHQPNEPWLLFQPQRWNDEFPFILAGLALMGWFNFRFMHLLIWSALEISRTAQRITEIDLMDTSLVQPYAQHGVRSSLLAVVGLSISSNLWLDPNSPAIATFTTLVMLVSATAVALFLPTWGIHLRLRTAKETELRNIRQAIAARSDPQLRTPDDAQQLPADIAYEKRLMEVSEWPFDAGSYVRVILYILLGLGSWVGAALVERILEALG